MFNKLKMKMTFNLKTRLKFYRIMSRQTDEKKRGVKPLLVINSLIKIQEQSKGKQTSLSKIYRFIKFRLELGKSLGETLQEFVPATEASQIYAAEMSGKISDGFIMAMDVAKQQQLFSKEFKSALISPTINLCLSFGVINMFFKTLVPAMSNSLSESQMSSLSLFLIDAANYFNYISFATIMIALVVVSWTIWALPNYNGRFRIYLEKIPPFSMYKLMVGCSFLYSLNSLMKSRVAQQQALLTIKRFASPYLTLRINKILAQTNKSIGEAMLEMRLDFPDKEVIDELAMASEQGVITEALPEITEDLSVDGVELVKMQAQVAKTATMLVTVASLMTMLVGIFSFLSDMQSTVNF